MELIAYYEGSDAVKGWLTSLLGVDITFRKMPTRNSSSEFARLPAYVSDILYLDKPDIILACNIDNIHEKPIFSIEFASCTPQYQHALQRFSRMMASVSAGCPSALIMPMKKKENDSGIRMYVRSRAVEYGAVRLMDTYDIPAFIFDWPDENGSLLNESGTTYPCIDSYGIQKLKRLLKKSLVPCNIMYFVLRERMI